MFECVMHFNIQMKKNLASLVMTSFLVTLETKWREEITTPCLDTRDGWSNVDGDGFQFLKFHAKFKNFWDQTNFLGSTDIFDCSSLNKTLEQITFDKIFANIIKKQQVTHFTPPGWGKMGHLPGFKRGVYPLRKCFGRQFSFLQQQRIHTLSITIQKILRFIKELRNI